jgi:hypothetical protein
MFPDEFEPLSFSDNVLVSRINLGCAAIGLVVFALLADSLDWRARSFALVAAACLVLLARQVEVVLRHLDPALRPDRDEPGPAAVHYLFPF